MQIQVSLLLDRSRADTLTAQLVSQLRDAIRLGRIATGVRLPSSRRLSEQLGIGRNTVVRAYESLEMECYVELRPASGMFATVPPFDARAVHRPPALRQWRRRKRALRSHRPRPVSNRGRLSFDFAPSRPNAGLFPLKTWRRALQTCLSQGGALGLTQPGRSVRPGLAALGDRQPSRRGTRHRRRTRADHHRQRNRPRRLRLATRLLVSPGALVCVETPVTGAPPPRSSGRRRAVSGAGGRGGARDRRSAGTPGRAAVCHAVASVPDRAHAVAGAPGADRRLGSPLRAASFSRTIVGRDFRYEGGTPQAIAAYAPDRTIYVGSFSQSLGAGPAPRLHGRAAVPGGRGAGAPRRC